MIPIANSKLKFTPLKKTDELVTHPITPSTTIKAPKTSDINAPINLRVFMDSNVK